MIQIDHLHFQFQQIPIEAVALALMDYLHQLLVIIFQLSFQTVLNLMVVVGLIPVTGVTLPFLSYGGSSLVMNFIMMGIMDNIAKKNDYDN